MQASEEITSKDVIAEVISNLENLSAILLTEFRKEQLQQAESLTIDDLSAASWRINKYQQKLVLVKQMITMTNNLLLDHQPQQTPFTTPPPNYAMFGSAPGMFGYNHTYASPVSPTTNLVWLADWAETWLSELESSLEDMDLQTLSDTYLRIRNNVGQNAPAIIHHWPTGTLADRQKMIGLINHLLSFKSK